MKYGICKAIEATLYFNYLEAKTGKLTAVNYGQGIFSVAVLKGAGQAGYIQLGGNSGTVSSDTNFWKGGYLKW